MEKKDKIISGVRRILLDYEDTGIFKSKLIEILQREKICFKKTFYAYLNDGKFEGVFEEKGDNRYKKIYPTENSRNLTIFKHKLEKLDKLLDFIGGSDVGDVIWTPERMAECRNIELEEMGWWFRRHEHFTQSIHIMESNASLGTGSQTSEQFSLSARYDLLKNLPLFLSAKISEYTQNQTMELDQEYFTAIQPLVFKSLQILRHDYPRSTLCQSSLLDDIFKMADSPQKTINLHSLKGVSSQHITVNFLKILTRYYFNLSIVFSDDMAHESRNEQKKVSRVIEEFYPKNNAFDKYDKILTWENIDSILEATTPPANEVLAAYYGLGERSLAMHFMDDLNSIENNDLYFVRIYTLELFKTIDIFTDVELRWLCYCDQKLREKEIAEVDKIKNEINVQTKIDSLIEKLNTTKSEKKAKEYTREMFLKMIEQKKLRQEPVSDDAIKNYEKNFDEKFFKRIKDTTKLLGNKD
ncbi:MAG: hypothetical protein GKS07_07395 [Nitrosopumilus sp.]|nr:MAG: hypothetical protein GKS07_07395 [Nitrosopumilus sp.]